MNKKIKKTVLAMGVMIILGGIIILGTFNQSKKIVAGINPPRIQQYTKELAGINPPRTYFIVKSDGINPPR